ncbi:MAG: hypothetical protein ABUS47_04880 [Steroidobacter sp.]
MSAQKIFAILLLTAGVLILAYGGFNYAHQTHQVVIGSVHLSMDDLRHVNMPVWMGVVAILTGGVLLLRRTN